jgi:integrase
LFLDFRWNGTRYRRQTTLADTPANRAQLQKVSAKISKQIDAGTFDYRTHFPDASSTSSRRTDQANVAPREQTTISTQFVPETAPGPNFRSFVDQWLMEHQIEWRRSHLRTLKSTLTKHLLPYFGDRPINRISRGDVLAFRTTLASSPGRRAEQRMSNKRINGIIGPLKQILNEAADRYGFQSPIGNLKPLKIRKSDVQPFSIAEVETILSTVRADYRDYLSVRFFTGMRSGEVDGLKWRYVDFEHRLILVREAFVLGEDEYTKTDGSQRDIQMSTPVFEALKRQEKATRELSDYVFCNKAGKPIDNKNFTERVWRPLLRHLGMPIRRPYQMRHTAATLWLAAGESPEWIARQLGHTSTQMLFKVYSRFVPNLTRQDGSAIDRLLTAALEIRKSESQLRRSGLASE